MTPRTDPDLARTLTVARPFAEVVPRVRAALARQGFGVLTEIDLTATLREKRGAEIEDFVILGACNPELAERAVRIDPRVGVLLPCNVVVRDAGAHTVVQVMNPELLATVTAEPGLVPIADEAGLRIAAVLAELGGADAEPGDRPAPSPLPS